MFLGFSHSYRNGSKGLGPLIFSLFLMVVIFEDVVEIMNVVAKEGVTRLTESWD